jgi:hypothetical protein
VVGFQDEEEKPARWGSRLVIYGFNPQPCPPGRLMAFLDAMPIAKEKMIAA